MGYLDTTAASVLVLVLYFGIVLYIGLVVWRQFPATDIESYALGGRSLGWLVTGLTLMATQYSALTFLGFPASMYTHGIGAYIGITGMYIFISAWYWMVFGPRTWKIGRAFRHMTPSDTLAHFYESRTVGLVAGALLILAVIPYLQTQIMGVAYMLEVATDGLVDFTVGAVLTYLIVAVIVYLGGMRSVAYVDAFQGFLLLFGIIGAAVLLIELVGGGLGPAFADVAERFASHLTVPGPNGVWTFLYLMTWSLAVGIGWAAHPHMWIRMHIPKDIRIVRFWPVWIAVSFPLVMGGGYLSATTGLVRYGTDAVPDQVVIRLIADHFPAVVLGLIAAAGLAAMMSSLSSQLHGLGVVFIQDLWLKLRRDTPSERQVVATMRGAVALLALVGLVLSFVNPELLITVGAFSAALGGQLMPVIICALSNQRWVTRQGALASMIGGTVVMFGTASNPLGVYAGAWGLSASVLLLVLVSLATRSGRPSAATIEKYRAVGW